MKFKIILSLLLLISLCTDINSQVIPKNKYGLKIIDSIELYHETVAKDSNKLLVDLEDFIPGIITDVKYATKDNFTKQVLYSQPKVYARYPVAKSLKKIQAELKESGYELKIFDAFRPYSVTEIMWASVLDDRYAADPKKGSRHNRGCAIDLTIVDAATGKELEMPTPFDDFTMKAHHAYTKLPAQVIKNRSLLRDIMVKYGFEPITSEWWHYDYKGWNSFELLNISYEDLEKENLK